MSWTSTNTSQTKEPDRNQPSRLAIYATGLGFGMLFTHALQFTDLSSGATPYLKSWFLFFTTFGTALGFIGGQKSIQKDRINRWGLVGWSGLITGIMAWGFPHISQSVSNVWISPGSLGGMLLVPSFVTGISFGLIPACFAGLGLGATCFTPGKKHIHSNGQVFGRLLISGSMGCFIAELLLIEKFGLEFSIPMTTLLWLVIGAGGLVAKAGGQIQDQQVTSEPQKAQLSQGQKSIKLDGLSIYLGLMAACSLSVWMRISDWVFGDTNFWNIYWPCLSLISIGIGFISPFGNPKAQQKMLAWGLVFLGVFCFSMLFGFDDLPFWLHSLKSQLGETTSGFAIHVLVYTFVFGGLILAPLYGIGCITDYTSKCHTKTYKTSPCFQMVLSTAFSWVILQHFLMPMLGLARVAGLGVAVAVALGIYFVLMSHEKWEGLSKIAAPICCILILSFTGSQFDKGWKHIFSQSDDISTGFFSKRSEASQWAYRSDQISYKESAQGSLAIHSYDYPGNTQLELRINGEVIERGFVHQIKPVINTIVPYILHGNPERVAIFGLRSGSAAGLMASLPVVKQLDGVEINQDLLGVIGQFSNSNGHLVERDSFRFHATTPTRFLNDATEKYDIIINQYARPWKSVNTPWFTSEFYKNCLLQLSEEGLMVQNIQSSHLDNPTLETVIATFGSVFHQTSIWNLGHGEWMLIGTREKREWSLDLLKERIESKEAQAILQTQDLAIWPMLLTTQITGFENGFHLVPDESLIHSKNFPSLRMLGNNAYLSPSALTLLEEANEHFDAHPSMILKDFARTNPWTVDQLRAFSILQLNHQLYAPKVFRSIVRRWLSHSPEETALQILASSTSKAESSWAYEAARLSALVSSFPADTEPPLELVKQAAYHSLQAYRDQRTFIYQEDTQFLEAMLDHLIKKEPNNQRVYRMNLAELAWDQGEIEHFLKLSAEAFDPETETFGPVDYSAEPLAPYRTLALMAEYWWGNGQLEKAKDVCIQALQAKYIGPDAIFSHPDLEQTVRKILFSLDLPAQAASKNDEGLELESSETAPVF